jgi:hypothetical protein
MAKGKVPLKCYSTDAAYGKTIAYIFNKENL